MKEEVKDARITFRLTQEQKIKINKLCEKQGRSTTDFIRAAIEKYMEKEGV